jgi:putative phosphoesterase
VRIGLISDTHIPWERKELPTEVMDAFQGVDLILHAGDIYAQSVLDDLERIAPVLAAFGDDDYPRSDPRLQHKHVLEFEGLKLWLVHERPYTLRFPLSHHKNGDGNEEEKFSKPDIIVFGHEHQTVVEHSDSVLYINSGSPTFLNYQRGLGTVGILELEEGKADVQIIQL